MFGQLRGDSDVMSILALAWRASEPIGMNRQVGSISILALAWRASPFFASSISIPLIFQFSPSRGGRHTETKSESPR